MKETKRSRDTPNSGFYQRLSNDLKNELPGVKGLSPTNLKYMKYYYELFQEAVANCPQLVDDLRGLLLGHITLFPFLVQSFSGISVPSRKFLQNIL